MNSEHTLRNKSQPKTTKIQSLAAMVTSQSDSIWSFHSKSNQISCHQKARIFAKSSRSRRSLDSVASKSLQQPGNLSQVSRGGLGLGRKAAMLTGIAVADRCARVIAAVHPASPLPLHGWGLAFRSQAGLGKAARGLGQPLRLHGIVCQIFHFSHSPRDGGIRRQ